MKLFQKIIAALATLGAMVACVEEPEVIKVTGVEVNPSTITLEEKESFTLGVTVIPETATDKTVKWSSSDMGIVAVQDGLIKAISQGTAIVTATANDGSGASGHCIVTVVEAGVAVKGVKLSPDELNLAIGDKATLTAEVEPSDAANKNVIWFSSDESVATVNDGEVEAIAEGEATITVKTVYGGHTATCKVHVSTEVVQATDIYFEQDHYSVTKGESIQLTVSCVPDDARSPELKWSSDDTKVATVSSAGLVTGKNYGVAVIKAESKNDPGMYAECTVTVSPKADDVKSINLSQEEIWLIEGDEDLFHLYVETDPEGFDINDMDIELTAAESEINSSKDPVIWNRVNTFTIQLEPVAAGDCYLNFSAGAATASALIHIRKVPKSFEIDADYIALQVGNHMSVNYIMTPDKPEYRLAVKAYTDDSVVAFTTKDGGVFGQTVGKTVLHAYPAGLPDLEKCCNVYVYNASGPKIDNIKLNKKEVFLHAGEEDFVTAIIDPSDSKYPVDWYIEDENVAEITVSEGGGECTVRGRELGRTVLHVRSVAGSKVDVTCNITVAEDSDVESVTLPESRTMKKAGTIYLTANITGNYKTIEWINYDPELIRVTPDKKDPKTAKIDAWSQDGFATVAVLVDNYHIAYCKITVGAGGSGGDSSGSSNGHDYVDLGLSVKWATCNVGASKPEEYGDYFAWGETVPYYADGHSQDEPCSSWRKISGRTISGYNWETYLWSNDDGSKFTRYCPSDKASYWGGKSIPDGKTDFKDYDYKDDAARANWGDSWRMPTDAEWTELRDECTWKWTTLNGINGRLVTGPNGNRMFLPAAGGRGDTHIDTVGEYGFYWSSSLFKDNPFFAYDSYFNYATFDWNAINRSAGQSVRPVLD